MVAHSDDRDNVRWFEHMSQKLFVLLISCNSFIITDLSIALLVSGNCMSNCVGKANGDYHSCSGCDVFASCLDDVLYDNRECAANLVWDDTLKRCEYTSPTCETP